MDHVLGVYVDSQNPKIHESLANFLYELDSLRFARKIGQICILLIGFVRESVVNTDICDIKFGPCIESITIFYNKLPDDKFDITTTLVENLDSEVKEKGSIHHFQNYFNNYTHYSPFIDQILLLEAKYGLDAYTK